MRVCIHRGTQEVGGTCIEIESKGKRLVLDLGQPLNADLSNSSLPKVKGFADFDESLLGLFISHPHLDHYGLVGKINPDISILIGGAAKRIINSAKKFFPGGISISNSIDLKHLQKINLEPFVLTPYLVDHSAYDSYALLVEADSKRLFYTGDFRAHGRKSGLFEKLLANPPKEVNALLMEGTTIDRTGIDAQYPSENDLEERLVRTLKESSGLTLLWTSGQNIDRLVTAYRACRQAGKDFIVDMYTAGILRAIENPRIPQPGFSGFKVFLPWFQKKKIIDQKLFDYAESFSSCRIYPEQLKDVAKRSVMLFRPSMMMDLLKAECLEDAMLVYSLWSGYLQDDSSKRVLNWLKQNSIPMIKWHTSGHAPVKDLKRLSEGIKPKMLIPIHSFEPQSYLELFKNVSLKADGEWWDVA